MSQNNSPLKKFASATGALFSLAVFIALSPLLILMWLIFLVSGLILALRWHYKYGRHGKTFLAIYSDSPKWEEYFSGKIVPILGNKAVVVNISTDSVWREARSIERLAHHHWAGDREHTPIVLFFSSAGRVKRISLYEAFIDYVKRGDESNLHTQIEKLKTLVAP